MTNKQETNTTEVEKELSKLLSEDEVEVLFQKHLDDKVGSGTRRTFYANNNALEASARTAFKAAFSLLMPIIEKQSEALNSHDCSFVFWLTGCHQCKALQETKQMLEQLGVING